MFPTNIILAEVVSLKSVANDIGAKLYWDTFLNQLVISKDSRSLYIFPGSDTAILNSTIPVALPGLRFLSPGQIEMTSEAKSQIMGLLSPRSKLDGRTIQTIFIDPGHGGKDPGTIGRHSINGGVIEIMEKDLVLLVSKQVTELLKRQYPEKNVVLSREDDVYLTLEERTTKANSISRGKNEDILYISIHANASLNSSAKGYEVWYLPPEYRRDLISPEEKEGYEETVIPILNTLLEEEYTVESILLAQSILTGLDSTIGTLSPNRGLLQEEWYVVRNARMPSVLIEIGFVTNKQEFQLLTSSEYLQKISQGIYTGITSFVSNFEEVR
jgi:N-acetylmuramoyl-L-alanine amidase